MTLQERQKWKGSLEDRLTCKVDVAGALEWARLRPRLQQEHLGTIDRVELGHRCIHNLVN